MNKADVLLLTKPPHDSRTRLCLLMLENLEDAVLYLAGDGVYNLLDIPSLMALPKVTILACKEDMAARGIEACEQADASDEFYRLLAEDMNSDRNRMYVF